MPRGREYDVETKAKVLAALLAGDAPQTAAKAHGVPLKTVYGWRKEQRAPRAVVISEVVVQTKKEKRSDDLGELVGRYLEALLLTLTEQAVIVRDPGYVRSQNAADLAILHGTMADKAFRILTALHSVEEAPQPAPLEQPFGAGGQAHGPEQAD